MNVLQIRMAVLNSVQTLLDHISVAVTVDTVFQVIEDLVLTLMNVALEHITANIAASTL